MRGFCWSEEQTHTPTSRSKGQGWHVGARAGAEGTATSRSCSALHSAWSECRQHGAARARRKRTCWASSPERESAEARKRATRASQTSRSEGKGWYVGAQAWRRRNGGVSLVQCPSAVYEMSVASAARRARVGSARAGPRPQRERAQESASVLRAQAT